MDRKGVITVIILILIFDKGSDASLLGRFRTVAGLAPRVKLPVKEEISPSPSPTSILNFDPSHLNPENSTDVGPKVSDGQAAPSPQAKIHVDKDETNQKGDESDSPVDSSRGECAVAPNRCIDNKKMVACLKHHENGPQELFLLVQNDGESTLKVNITVPASVKIPVKELEIPKHRVKKVCFHGLFISLFSFFVSLSVVFTFFFIPDQVLS
uniref:DUF7356 domain-containing protein n=1 Tax=Nelumbo nucifera TaxID=4432 RepID=A0A822Y3B2_NELNU|nr:TPA_asm: hypothetical protein HUJ06_027247 [Nelumbo nucifera]